MNIKICDNTYVTFYVTIKYNWYKNKVVFSSIFNHSVIV